MAGLAQSLKVLRVIEITCVIAGGDYVVDHFTRYQLAFATQRIAVNDLYAYSLPSCGLVNRAERIVAAVPVMLSAGLSGVIVNLVLSAKPRLRELTASRLATLAPNLPRH
jgi:hypothetical protein